ncbi:MAG: type IV secretion system protein, partial [Promethearchaeota archaeon]
MKAPLSITIQSTGRNIIPTFKNDPIIQLHGRNGVGKSMAATMMEIAAGNYIFKDFGQFSGLKGVIESCTIELSAGDSRSIRVKLIPSTWRFNQSSNTINPETIGLFYYNNTEIPFTDFKKKVNVRVIRGDESLEQQILFFKDIFTSKINQKIDDLNRSTQILDMYKKKLTKKIDVQVIKEYHKKQDHYSKILDRKNALETTITSRKQLLDVNGARIPILENLRYYLENAGIDVEEEKRRVQDNIEFIEKDLEKKIKEKIELEGKLKELSGKIDKDREELLKKKDTLEKQRENIRNKLSQYFDDRDISRLRDEKAREVNIKNTENQIKTLESFREKLKGELDKANTESDSILGINGFISRMEEYCEQIKDKPFSNEKFIKINLTGEEHSLSPLDMLAFLKESHIPVIEDAKFKEFQRKVAETSKQIKELDEQKELLKRQFSIEKKINAITQKLALQGNNLSDAIDEGTAKFIPNRLNELESTIDNLHDDLRRMENKLEDIKSVGEKLETIQSKHVLATQLRDLGCDLKPLDLDTCVKELTAAQKHISRNQVKLEEQEAELQTLQEKFSNARKEVDDVSNKLRASSHEFGFSKFGEFITYIEGHFNKMEKLLASFNKITKKLRTLRNDMEAVISGKNAKNPKNNKIIIEEFDRIFKEMYGNPEFFKFVFKDYRSIKRFDIKNRTIIFETKTGLEESRDLNEFSSGEKTYAYCRAIISMLAHSADYCIIILDESYALLDHEHSKDLYQFQKQQVKDGGVAKFINILPLKEDLQERI